MSSTVTLGAISKFGYSGQYVARINGRDKKFQFNREFVGRKFGKRNESSSYDTDEIGLYEECDVSKSGKSSSYALVLTWKDGLRKMYINKEDALAIAKRLDDGEKIDEIAEFCVGEPMTETITRRVCDVCGAHRDYYSCDCSPDAHVTPQTITQPKLNDDGTPAHSLSYRIVSKREAKAERAAANIDEAVNAIVTALAALPEKFQKEALKVAKAKLFPKPESTEQ